MAMYDEFKPNNGQVEQKKYTFINAKSGPRKSQQDTKCAINNKFMCLIQLSKRRPRMPIAIPS